MRTRPLLSLMTIGLSASATTAQPSFVTIGDLPGSLHNSYAYGVSDDGAVVAGRSYASDGITAFQWTHNEGLQSLPRNLGPGTSTGVFISPSGNHIAGRYAGLGAIWLDGGDAVSVGDLPGGIESSYIFDVDDQGRGVGQSAYGTNPFGAPLVRAIQWLPSGGLQALPLPHPDDEMGNSVANAILPDGRILGVSDSGTWFYSETDGFEMLPGATGMSRSTPDGNLLAGLASNPDTNASAPAIWTRDEGLTFLPGIGSGVARSLSDDGSIIVGNIAADEVVWVDQGDPVPVEEFAESFGIDMTGWRINNVGAISADGSTIVGSARHDSWEAGRIEGFVLTIPAPGTIGVLGVALLSAGCRRRRSV